MKLNKKKVFVAALAICVVAILSFSTLAWFTDSESMTNNFMTATSDDDTPDSVFSVDLYEIVNDGDDADTDPDRIDTNGANFTGVLPGEDIIKAPVVVNTGKYDQWIRVKITVSDWTAWKALAAKYNLQLEDIFTPVNDVDTLWDREEIIENTTADTATYVYYLIPKLAPSKEVGAVFQALEIPGAFTQEDMINGFGTDGFSITVVAEAIQADNTGDSAVDAFKLWA